MQLEHTGPVKPDQPSKLNVILLNRDTQRFSEALRIGQALADAQASVILVCLCAAGLDPETQGRFRANLNLAGQTKPNLSITWCQAGHLPPAWTDLPTISLDRLAEKLKTADLIVPV